MMINIFCKVFAVQCFQSLSYLQREMYSTVLSCVSRCRQRVMVTSQARTLFWWGHDTIEDQAARNAEADSKGVIAWTDPNKELDKKRKEFTWAPDRIEEEANHAYVMNWGNRKIRRAMWHAWATDPVHFREEMRSKAHQHLVP